MRIIEITDKQKLNEFVGSRAMSQFLQSWEWGEFQTQAARKVIRLGIEESGELLAAATLVKKKLFWEKSYFYCPRGPIIVKNEKLTAEEIFSFLFIEVKKRAEQEKVIFLRFEPGPGFYVPAASFKQFTIIKTLDVQPSKTLILNLNLPAEEILKRLGQKTRYNIRLAEKKGVKVLEAGPGRFEEFWRLLTATVGRDNFNPHSKNYYKGLLEMKERVKLLLAEYKGRPIAAVLISLFGDTATYLHGGSADEERQAMAPYLAQWQAIKLAKARGLANYDLHGVDEKKWPGVTRFKKGFGGREVNHPGAFDLVFNPGWYNIYKMARKVRRTF